MAGTKYDLLFVGGGPGGYVGAIRGAQLGMKTAVVEREHLGGICLNWGCIPTKALLRTSEIRHVLHNASDFGLVVGEVSLDVEQIVSRSRAVARQLNQGVGHLLRKNKVEVIMGEGALAGPRRLAVTNAEGKVDEFTAEHIVLATGARARSLPGLVPDGQRLWSYREAMVPKELPKSLLVIGSGAIGIEFASFYADLGTEVTVVEIMDRILPAEDSEISDFALRALRAQGMTIHTGARVISLESGADGVSARILGAEEKELRLDFDRVVLAIGIVGNVEGLGLEDTAARIENDHVVVNKWLEAGEPGLYAIGDLVGPPWLAHKASHEGTICVERIAGHDTRPLDTSLIPGCTYSRPQIASIGLTEDAARERGHDVRVGKFPYIGNGKAIALGESEGLVKTVFDQDTGELLGAHMIGAEVTELIHGFAIARTLECTEADLMETVFPHPTLSEMMHESVLNAFGRTIHF